MSFARRRSGRSDWLRRPAFSPIEVLETRQLLTTGLQSMASGYLAPWLPTDQFVTNPITHQRELYLASMAINPKNPNSPGLTNEGKVVSGTDREGDQWTITVHGPGKVIVTDTTPNDGLLDDDIDTIQIVGSNLKTTYVTGNVFASNKIPANFNGVNPSPSNGTILFNNLTALAGVKSIELNGFDLSNQVTPAVTSTTGIFLYGGVGTLSFDSIDQTQNTAISTTPYQIVIGNPTTPLKVEPSIFLNNITNLVFNGSSENDPSTTPLTTPSVEFEINGTVRNFNIISTGPGAVNQGFQVFFPPVGTTGRTSLQATAVDNLNVTGSAKNLTVSKAPVPFSSENSGVKFLKKATFGGNADGVGIDVKGKIGSLKFKRGLGNPNGVFTSVGSTGLHQPTTIYGTPSLTTGYPAAGDLGGQIRAKSIGKLSVNAANVNVQTPQDPSYGQLIELGYPVYVSSTGTALTNAVIVTSGSIDDTSITGTSLNTEIKTGFDLTSYLAGLEGTRSASQIAALTVNNGDLTNSIASASVRPQNHNYAKNTVTFGPGKINVKVTNTALNSTGGTTGLGNTGTGVFARKKRLLK
jgi:hypothetical protein